MVELTLIKILLLSLECGLVQNLNTAFINNGLKQSVRLERLNKIAISQIKILNESNIK